MKNDFGKFGDEIIERISESSSKYLKVYLVPAIDGFPTYAHKYYESLEELKKSVGEYVHEQYFYEEKTLVDLNEGTEND